LEHLIQVLEPFLNTDTSIDDAKYVIIGAPIDVTSSYRSGARFGPKAIRQASHHIETYSIRTQLDCKNISIADSGNVDVLDSVEDYLDHIQSTISFINKRGKIPVVLGGEHTIALAALRALQPELVIVFDAHLDLRNKLFGAKTSHGTFLRRAFEEIDFKVIIIGCRAQSIEERKYAEKYSEKIKIITAKELRECRKTWEDEIKKQMAEVDSVYISFDMDVIDPSSAPAVGNPTPEGLSITDLLDLVNLYTSKKIVGFDLTEVTPHYDSGLTAIQAAYLILETICSLEKNST
jgi:agmatinase